jgi:hypothetical protein
MAQVAARWQFFPLMIEKKCPFFAEMVNSPIDAWLYTTYN